MLQITKIKMAASIRASKEGLNRIDKARRQKGWTKTEQAWIDLALTSKATLRRFLAGIPIQTETFKQICIAVGIDDWEEIADHLIQLQSSKKGGRRKLIAITVETSFEDCDPSVLANIIANISLLGGDQSIEIVDIDDGSIKLIFSGSEQALHRILNVYQDSQLQAIVDYQVSNVDLFSKAQLVQLIHKNGANGLNLQNIDLSKVNLNGADLTGANLVNANLSGTDLTGANLSEANLSGSNLNEAYLSRADLSGSLISLDTQINSKWRRVHQLVTEGGRGNDLNEADLSQANLSRTDLSWASLIEANLSQANLSQANLSQANLSQANLSQANLSQANLSQANLSRAGLGGTNLHEADLSRVNLEGSLPRWATILRAILLWANLNIPVFDRFTYRLALLIGPTLRNVNRSSAFLWGANLVKANLNEAKLNEAEFNFANLSEANLSEANLSGASLNMAFLCESNLRWADLRWADLSESDLVGADLRWADLRWADLRWANLSRANLENSNIKAAVFQNNPGLSESEKNVMKRCGAIFLDNPDSDIPSLV